MELLSGHDWPGNVRELRNVVGALGHVLRGRRHRGGGICPATCRSPPGAARPPGPGELRQPGGSRPA
ncbi:MAG: hypothetical protein R3F43_09710 [bacterium]